MISFTLSSAKVSGSSAKPTHQQGTRQGDQEEAGSPPVVRTQALTGMLHSWKTLTALRAGQLALTQGVEGLAGVDGVQALTSGATIHTVALHQAHQDHLASQGGHDVLGVHLHTQQQGSTGSKRAPHAGQHSTACHCHTTGAEATLFHGVWRQAAAGHRHSCTCSK